MRRLIVLAAGITAAVLGFATPASAATVTHLLNHTFTVGAEWKTFTNTSFSDTMVFAVAGTPRQMVLFVDQLTTDFVNFQTETTAFVTSGFTLTHTALNTATLSASGVPATACTIEFDTNQTTCSDTTVDLSATWTGQGAIEHDTFNSHFRIPGQFSEVSHQAGQARLATAAGVVNGVTVTFVADLDEATMEKGTGGIIIICTGAGC
jgi:hypothetical protein